MQPTIVSIVGKPLAGKDTQADFLVRAHPDSVKISTGHIIRGVSAERETHRFWPLIGPYIPMMEKGYKLPDEPTLTMLKTLMKEEFAQGKTLLVIAGSPRGNDQLDGFNAIAHELGASFYVVHLDATDEETYRRSALRNEGRIDDTPEAHKVRLEEYETYVAPMVARLKQEGNITTIDGMQPPEKVFRDMEHFMYTHGVDPEASLPVRARR